MEKFNNLLQELDFCGYEEGIEKIKEAGNHLIGIINDVLEVSRIEQGKINIENEESDIYELMTDFYNLVEIQAAVKKQKIETSKS